MHWAQSVYYWFSGGEQQYHTLMHCMSNQTGWVVATVVLDLAVFAGYLVIASHWLRNERTLPPSPARRALADVRNIFTFCGICGYLFIPIKLVWPAWRLYDAFMLALVFFTWRYAFNVKGLKVLYSAVGRSDQLESDLSAARAQTEQKDRFLNAVGRDLRTPLDRLLRQVERTEVRVSELKLTGQAGSVVAELSQSVSDVKATAQITSGLLVRLLDYARLDAAGDALTVTACPLVDVIADALASHRYAATAKGLDVSVAVPAGLPVRTDRPKLERVLDALIGNAVKFTAAGSVRVTAESAAAGTEIHVTDTGVGIPPEHLAHVFDEFFQMENPDRDRELGLGLGLAVARRLARQLGGDLTVTSTVASGSRFTVILPEAVVLTPTPPGGEGVASVSPVPQPAAALGAT